MSEFDCFDNIIKKIDAYFDTVTDAKLDQDLIDAGSEYYGCLNVESVAIL